MISLNILEFRGKRRKDAAEMARFDAPDRLETWLALRQYRQTQNIEQVLHILNTVLIATLVAVLTA